MRNAHKKLSAGFTLIELIVVIFIITILLTIIVPNVRNSREKARGVHCRNNLRQFLVAMNQQAADNPGWTFSVQDLRDGGGFVDPSLPGQYNLGDRIVPQDMFDGFLKVGDGVSDDSFTTADGRTIYRTSALRPLVENYISKPDETPEASVAYCPYTYKRLDVFKTNSPNFKGYRINEGATTAAGYYETDWGKSTYGYNSDQQGRQRGDIKGDTIAFIDWNHREGWGNVCQHGAASWKFTNPSMGAYQDSGKGSLGCLTEVGFYHTGSGEGMGANAVFFDGRAEWISQYAITNVSLWQ